jgi:hypothetical protein
MGRKKRLDQCKSGPDFVQYSQRQGAFVKHGTRHDIIYNDRGQVASPRHNKDLPTGTRNSIMKGLIAIGITVAILGCGAAVFFTDIIAAI